LHPNVTIDVTSTDLRGYEQKLSVALPSHTSTDIVIRAMSIMAPFVDEGLLAPVPTWLQTFVGSGAFDDSTVQLATYKDEIWGVPIFVANEGIFYNKDMFAAAGLQPPTTMDEVVSDAYALTMRDANGNVTRSGLSLRLSGQGSGVAEKWWDWLMQYSTAQVPEEFLAKTPDGRYHAAYASAAGAKLLVMHVNMVNKQPYVDDPNIDHDAGAFETQKTAMFMRESWVIGDIALNAPELNYGCSSNADDLVPRR
jgi:multiple sugar transport system substrate-binding protein